MMETAPARASERDHFRVTGEGFTTLARGLFLDDRPDKAWRLIVNGLGGGVAVRALAEALLDGHTKLVGDERSMEDVSDDDPATAEYRRHVQWLYAGRYHHPNGWYRPRAIVTDLGPEDAYAASRLTNGVPSNLPHDGAQFERWSLARVAWYGSREERVIDTHRFGPMLWEPVGPPPVWWPENTSPDAAINHFLAAGRVIEETGYRKMHPPTREEVTRLAKLQGAPLRPDGRAEGATIDPTRELRWSRKEPEGRSRLTPEARRDADARERLRVSQERAEAARFDALCAAIATTVRERAGDRWIVLKDDAGHVIARVPEDPFQQWALWRTCLKHRAPLWEPVSPVGLKQGNDDPYHTDWYLGAGFDLKKPYPYDGPLHKAAMNAVYELQERLGRYECAVLVAGHGQPVTGVIGKDIVVVPDLSMKHVDAVLGARAVITEAGGAGAHLALLATEKGTPILYSPFADHALRSGLCVTVFPDQGRVLIQDTHIERSTLDPPDSPEED